MNVRQMLKNVFAGKGDKLPVIEWASWWDKTIENWEKEGLPQYTNDQEVSKYFGLDKHYQIWLNHRSENCPKASSEGGGIIQSRSDYDKIKKHLYSKKAVENAVQKLNEIKTQENCFVWITLDGFFWYPRTLFGIQKHLYAFYDEEQLMEEINNDYAEYCTYAVEEILKVITPDFITLAEDLSYNKGPMLSHEHFLRFITPQYKKILPQLKQKGVPVFVDTDGDVTSVVPWLMEAGIDGILPLERQSMVDVCELRKQYPHLLMIGGFDKRTMRLGEREMREEFERILPAVKSGRYIPSTDHQTPPDVSLKNYKIYVSLLKEYCNR